MKNVVLIGFMGAGKSSTGRMLALGARFSILIVILKSRSKRRFRKFLPKKAKIIFGAVNEKQFRKL